MRQPPDREAGRRGVVEIGLTDNDIQFAGPPKDR
jgi:hypothetical protein